MADVLFCTIYILLFSSIILKAEFFRLPGFKSAHTLLAFFLKLISGLTLWYIYEHHYKNRLTSDIFKYYDDAALLYNTIHHSFTDFLKMLTGIGDNSHEIQSIYNGMSSWVNSYQSGFYNNSHFIIRLNAFFFFFSQGHYGVHVIFMCFISLLGLVYLYKAFYRYLGERRWGLFAAIFLFPSALLWGSGILKEGIIFLGMGFSIYYFEKFLNREGNPFKTLILTAIGLVLIFEAKAYVVLCLIPCLIAEFLLKRINICGRHPGITYIAVIFLYLGIGFNLRLVSNKHDPLKMLALKQLDFNRVTRGGIYLIAKGDSEKMYTYLRVEDSNSILPANPYSDSLMSHHGIEYLASPAFTNKEINTNTFAWFTLQHGTSYDRIRLITKDTLHLVSNDFTQYRIDIYEEPAKSRITIAPIEPTIKGLISHIPQALAISLIRPMPSEIHSTAVLFYFIENIFVLLLIMVGFAFIKRENLKRPMVGFCFTYCALMLILIGLVTPLYGGIERYKCVVIPFLLILLLQIYNKEKLKRLFNRNKN